MILVGIVCFVGGFLTCAGVATGAVWWAKRKMLAGLANGKVQPVAPHGFKLKRIKGGRA